LGKFIGRKKAQEAQNYGWIGSVFALLAPFCG
jgi:hypothetical protein